MKKFGIYDCVGAGNVFASGIIHSIYIIESIKWRL